MFDKDHRSDALTVMLGGIAVGIGLILMSGEPVLRALMIGILISVPIGLLAAAAYWSFMGKVKRESNSRSNDDEAKPGGVRRR